MWNITYMSPVWVVLLKLEFQVISTGIKNSQDMSDTKKWDLSNITNFRPILSLVASPKYLKLINFIFPEISNSQVSFLKKRSCVSQMLVFLWEINEAIDLKCTAEVIYLDFRKAFDSSHMKNFCISCGISI